MSQKNRVDTPGKIPFSWENKPGISKVQTRRECAVEEEEKDLMVKLPPPPCPSGGCRIPVHDFQIPLPPCTFQPLPRSSSARGLRKHEDPFLAAFQECTKTSRKVKPRRFRFHIGSTLRSLFAVSCKSRSSVQDDSLVRVSELPYDREI